MSTVCEWLTFPMEEMGIGGLSLADDEEEGLSFGVAREEATGELHLRLVGHFLTDRPIRVVIMETRMSGTWRPVKGVTIKEASPDLFMFQFFHKLDMENVLKGVHGPSITTSLCLDN